jgi:hypothetical protein
MQGVCKEGLPAISVDITSNPALSHQLRPALRPDLSRPYNYLTAAISRFRSHCAQPQKKAALLARLPNYILWRGHLALARPQDSRQDDGTANQYTTV